MPNIEYELVLIYKVTFTMPWPAIQVSFRGLCVGSALPNKDVCHLLNVSDSGRYDKLPSCHIDAIPKGRVPVKSGQALSFGYRVTTKLEVLETGSEDGIRKGHILRIKREIVPRLLHQGFKLDGVIK